MRHNVYSFINVSHHKHTLTINTRAHTPSHPGEIPELGFLWVEGGDGEVLLAS